MLFTQYINQVVEVQINQVEDQIKHLQDLLSSLQAQKQTLLSVEQQCESGINQIELAYDSVKSVCPEMMGTLKNRVLAIFDESSQLPEKINNQDDEMVEDNQPDQPIKPNDNGGGNTIEVQSIEVQSESIIEEKKGEENKPKDNVLTYDELYLIDTQVLIKVAENLGVEIEGNKTRKKLANALIEKVTPEKYQEILNNSKTTKSIVKA